MKKLLLQLVFVLLPFFALAQGEAPMLKDFSKNVRGMKDVFKLNENVYVMSIDLDFEKFELVAIDDKMQVLWRTTLKGFFLGAGKFKGHILAIAAADYSRKKYLSTSPYTGYLVDPLTGKQTLEKVIYQSNAETREHPTLILNDEGSYGALLIRRSGMDKARLMSGNDKETKDLSLLTLDDKLNTNILKFKIPEGEVVNQTHSNKGDIFYITRSDKNEVNAYRYEAGKTEPDAPISLNLTIGPDHLSVLERQRGQVLASSNNRKLLYFAWTGKNSNGGHELTVFKINFEDHTFKTVSEVFDKDRINDIKKTYITVDKDLDKPDLEPSLLPKDIIEWNGTIVVILSNIKVTAGYGDTGLSESALFIAGYNTDLKPKFQQILPAFYRHWYVLGAGYYGNKNSLYVIASSSTGIHLYRRHPSFGQLDLSTGNWLKFEKLPKGKIDDDYLVDKNVLWFQNSFIVPFYIPHFVLYKQDITLQLNTY